jgi:hypothetical protein
MSNYLGRTDREYSFPFLHNHIQTHGYNRLLPRHKGFLNAYNEMSELHAIHKKNLTLVEVYPYTIFMNVSHITCEKTLLTYDQTI